MAERLPTAVTTQSAQYVHFVEEGKELLEGHKLFLRGLPNNNMFDTFLSLMPKNEDGNSDCKCYRKLIFCGYNVEQHITDATNETNYVIKPGSEITNPRVCRNCKDDESYPKLRNDLDLMYAQRYSGK